MENGVVCRTALLLFVVILDLTCSCTFHFQKNASGGPKVIFERQIVCRHKQILVCKKCTIQGLYPLALHYSCCDETETQKAFQKKREKNKTQTHNRISHSWAKKQKL